MVEFQNLQLRVEVLGIGYFALMMANQLERSKYEGSRDLKSGSSGAGLK